MIQLILRFALLLFGYSIMGLGLLGLFIVTNFLLNVFPEILGAQILAILITLAGLKTLSFYDKQYNTKQPWRRNG